MNSKFPPILKISQLKPLQSHRPISIKPIARCSPSIASKLYKFSAFKQARVSPQHKEEFRSRSFSPGPVRYAGQQDSINKMIDSTLDRTKRINFSQKSKVVCPVKLSIDIPVPVNIKQIQPEKFLSQFKHENQISFNTGRPTHLTPLLSFPVTQKFSITNKKSVKKKMKKRIMRKGNKDQREVEEKEDVREYPEVQDGNSTRKIILSKLREPGMKFSYCSLSSSDSDTVLSQYKIHN